MNYHCWRQTKTKVNEDDKLKWPKLSYPTIQERSQITKNLNYSEDVDLIESLDEFNYPKLGGRLSRSRENNCAEFQQMAVVENYADLRGGGLRIPRSTDLIHVNLQKTLESTNWPVLPLSYHPTKITVDICKLNVNMNVACPLSRWLSIKSKRKIMHVGRKKKLSRLKDLILHERMMKKQEKSAGKAMYEVTFNPVLEGDTSIINFDSLKISVVSQVDPELLKKMSALSCLSTDHRDSTEMNFPEDNCIFRPDLHDGLKKMSIEASSATNLSDDDNNTNAHSTNFIDTETMEATQSLKICDESEQCIDHIFIKNEPNRIEFTKKFREYCTNTVTTNLNNNLGNFLAEMSRLQKKMYERDRIKGASKRRYYAGIKEVRKKIDVKKIKFVIIAPDLEKVEIKGGLDDTLGNFVATCKRCEVPYCFGLGRRQLGYYTHGKGFVSCIGIANYSGAEEKLKNVLLEVVEARNNLLRLMSDEMKTIEVEKLLPREDLLLSEVIIAYFKIIASTS